MLSDIRASQYAFVDEVSYADKDYKESSWLYYYLEWAEGAFCSGNMCESDTDFIYDPFRKDTDICSGREEPCADLCAAYCPQNPNPDALERCTLSPDSSKCFCPGGRSTPRGSSKPSWRTSLRGALRARSRSRGPRRLQR